MLIIKILLLLSKLLFVIDCCPTSFNPEKITITIKIITMNGHAFIELIF